MKNKNEFIAIIISIIFIVIVSTLNNQTLSEQKIPANFYLSKTPGFDNQVEELNFGGIQINQSSSRKLNISNTYSQKVKIKIDSTGEISPYIIVSENNFYLEPKQTKEITFTVYTTGLTEYKEYKGTIIIKTLRL